MVKQCVGQGLRRHGRSAGDTTIAPGLVDNDNISVLEDNVQRNPCAQSQSRTGSGSRTSNTSPASTRLFFL
jgi:hypothetical protein